MKVSPPTLLLPACVLLAFVVCTSAAGASYGYDTTTTNWTNWADSAQASPSFFFQPTTEDEIVGIVQGVAERNGRLRVVGSSLSFSGQAATNDVMVSLAQYNSVLGVGGCSASGCTVHVQAGILVSTLNQKLYNITSTPLALPSLAGITDQTIAGVISTSSFGTGLAYGSFSTFVIQLRVILANGTALNVNNQTNQELFAAARSGLGALGIISEVWLSCIPLLCLEYDETQQTLAEVQAAWQTWAQEGQRFDYSWTNGQTNNVTVRTYKNTAKACNAANACSPTRFSGCVDLAYNVLAAPLQQTSTRYLEAEVLVPLGSVNNLVNDFNSFLSSSSANIDPNATYAIASRVVAADEISWLAMQYGRDSASVSFSVDAIANSTAAADMFEYFASGLANVSAAYGGRPHWGSAFSATASDLAPLYPHWDDFLALREQVDPEQVFMNEFLCQTLFVNATDCKASGLPSSAGRAFRSLLSDMLLV